MKNRIVLLMFLSTALLAHQEPGLLIKIPTRSRPGQLFRILDRYYALLSEETRYLFLITADLDDTTMNNAKCRTKLHTYPNLIIRFSENHSKIQAYNRDIDEFINDYDVILVTSDDMEPVAQGYDKIIMDTMAEQFPDYDGVLNFSDGFLTDILNTYPIIGKKFYQRFGYLYHPAYLSLACDLELSLVSKILKKEYVDTRVLIRHNHPGNGLGHWDPLYERNEALLPHDKKIFFERRIRNFDLTQQELESACTKSLSLIIGSATRNHTAIKAAQRTIEKQIHDINRVLDIECFICSTEQPIAPEIDRLLAETSGCYVAFIDADLQVSDEYIQTVLHSCASQAPFFSIAIEYPNGNSAYHLSLSNSSANFLNPVKRYLAVQFNSPDNRWGRSTAWIKHLSETGLITQETVIEKPLYKI